MSTYAAALAAIETELTQLDTRRAKLIAAADVMRQLVKPNVLPPISVTGAVNERTNERSKREASAGATEPP
jgi:hypothetical protein